MKLPHSLSAWSLRGRLLTLLVVLSTGLLACSATLFYFNAREASDKLFDQSLRSTAELILQLAQHEVTEHGLNLGVSLLTAETRPGPFEFRYQIWTEDMRSAYRSSNLPATPLMSILAGGFDWAIVNGQRWRAYATWNATHTLQIQIVQSSDSRRMLVRQTLLQLLATSLALLVAALALAAWIVSRTVSPLRRMAQTVAQRSPENLGPVDDSDAPEEVRPLSAAFNLLLERMREALAAERRFTADASHELRTPLAAIRANAQVLLGARNEAEKALTATDLLASVDRGARLIEQLLSLARADTPASGALQGEVMLDELLRRQVLEHAALASRRSVQLVVAAEAATVRGTAPLITVLLRNLLDNAIRYAPPHSTVTVGCRNLAGGVELTVSDKGPGIPTAERERIFERFYRIQGSEEPGSGLGLSIVRRIAERHGAGVSIEPGPQGIGTVVQVFFRNVA